MSKIQIKLDEEACSFLTVTSELTIRTAY